MSAEFVTCSGRFHVLLSKTTTILHFRRSGGALGAPGDTVVDLQGPLGGCLEAACGSLRIDLFQEGNFVERPSGPSGGPRSIFSHRSHAFCINLHEMQTGGDLP